MTGWSFEKMRLFLGYLAVLLVIAGCAPPFPKQTMDKVDRTVSFKDLQSDPERYKGRWVMCAGIIANVRNSKEGTYLEILQKPMTRSGRPVGSDDTEGRFMLFAKGYLDSAVYHTGREITVIGQASGIKEQPLGELEYRYPFLIAEDLHLWAPSTGPRVSFGFGVGISSHR